MATSSSVNTTLYASAGLTTQLAKIGQFPPIFGSGSRLEPHAGLSAIASVGSACSLLIFLLVGIAGYRRRGETGSRAPIVIAAIAVTATVLAFFAADTLQNAPETFAAIVAIAGLSVVLDLVWKGGAAPRPRGSPAPVDAG